jgi:hypothetical protein
MGEFQMTAVAQTARTHLQDLLLLSIWLRPDGCSMGTQSEEQPDEIREKEHSRREPGIGLHRFIVKTII